MSFDVIGRLKGGPNLIPGFSVNVYVSPLSVGVGTLVARSGTRASPAVPAMCLYVTSVRNRRSE